MELVTTTDGIVDLEGKVSYTLLNETEETAKDNFARTEVMLCVTIFYSYCELGNHQGGYEADGSQCPRHTIGSKTQCSSSGGGSPTNSDYDDGTNNETNHHTGGGTLSTNTDDENDINEPTIETVVTLTPLEIATNTFFDSLDQDEKDCLAAGFNQFKTEIINFFEDNQTVRPFGYDGPVIDADITDFANAAIDAHCAGGDVDFEDNVILSKEFQDNEKLKCVYDKLAGDNNSLFRDTVGAFIDNPNVNLIITVGECENTDVACTQDQYVDETGIITVIIEDINANPIELAQMIIHEAIHAEIAKFVSEFQSGVETNNRPLLFTLYAYHKGWADNVEPGYNWDNGADHHFIITNYVNRIATTLKQFDNDRYPLDYY